MVQNFETQRITKNMYVTGKLTSRSFTNTDDTNNLIGYLELGKYQLFVLFPFADNLIVETEERRWSETLVSTGCSFVLFLITAAVTRCPDRYKTSM